MPQDGAMHDLEITGPVPYEFVEILTPDALGFVEKLVRSLAIEVPPEGKMERIGGPAPLVLHRELDIKRGLV